jgi:hypothetical protein
LPAAPGEIDPITSTMVNAQLNNAVTYWLRIAKMLEECKAAQSFGYQGLRPHVA